MKDQIDQRKFGELVKFTVIEPDLRAHKCGDNECGHVPYMRKRISDLRITYCSAPKVNDGPKSYPCLCLCTGWANLVGRDPEDCSSSEH